MALIRPTPSQAPIRPCTPRLSHVDSPILSGPSVLASTQLKSRPRSQIKDSRQIHEAEQSIGHNATTKYQ